MHPEFAPVAFIAAFSLLLPLPWHWRTGNVATLSIVAWLFITNIIYAVDAVIWAGNVEKVAAVWCDISTKLIIGANFALPAACLCICIHLEQVSSVRIARYNISDKRRRQYFETFVCIGLPLIIMALHYVIQGHRFDIIEDYGCRPATYFSIPAIFIIWLPPILSAIGALIYAGLALRHFMRRRLSFAAHLDASSSALTPSRYLRLMAMSALQMFWVIGVTSYSFWFTVMAVPIRPWTTWSDVHSDFLRIDQFPAALLPPIVARSFCILWWLVPASTFFFVCFFSFGKDAMDEYRRCFSWFNTHVLRRTSTSCNLSKGFEKFNFAKKGRFLPTSNSASIPPSPCGTSITMFSLSSEAPHSTSSLCKPRSMLTSDYDTTSEASHYPPPKFPLHITSKTIRSITQLSLPPSPSSAACPPYGHVMHIKSDIPIFPPSPITPHSSQQGTYNNTNASETPISPRPFTYPSHDASHHSVNASIFGRK